MVPIFKVDKRSFLYGATLSTLGLTPVALAQDSVGNDWEVFTKLARLFDEISKAVDPIASQITRIKFVRLLNGINLVLFKIAQEKQNVEDALTLGSCERDEATVTQLATRAASKIIPLVSELQGKVEILASAIKPSGTRAAATALAREMQGLQSRKLWTRRTNGYCHFDSRSRDEFLSEIRASRRVVNDAELKLNTLLEKLSA